MIEALNKGRSDLAARFNLLRSQFRHRRLKNDIDHSRADLMDLISFVSTASLDRESLEKESSEWRTWANRFAIVITDRIPTDKRTELLSGLARQFSARRYAVMIEMLGVFFEGSDRAKWLPDYCQPYLREHATEPNKQEEFLLRLGVSAIPREIKRDMMLGLQKDYGGIPETIAHAFFSDPETSPLGDGGGEAGGQSLPPQHRRPGYPFAEIDAEGLEILEP